ncbi:MAG: ABC transporter ATP-binding protein [Spirochaetes bacterium]|nr:ABC transporter ATP-binding protein [Spirochaetota bacterium]
MNSTQFLYVRALKVQNGDFVLAIEDLHIPTNECIAAIGHNGAGKTTLLLALAGLIRPTMLDLIVEGTPITNFRAFASLRQSITMLFQEPLLLNATVRENIELGLKFRKIPFKARMRKINHYAEMLGIAHLLNRFSHTLSAGEARRVSLARSFVLEPKLLLMDEPFSSLDNVARNAILDDISNILKNLSCSVFLVSHNREEILRLADRIVVLNNGRVIQEGKPSEIINNPADEFTASFMGIETILTGKVVHLLEGGFLVDIDGKTIEISGIAQQGETITFGIRPENIVISKEKKYKSSMRNSFVGKVCGIAHSATHVRISINCGFKLIAHITPHSFQELKLAEGNTVVAAFKATAIHIFKK